MDFESAFNIQYAFVRDVNDCKRSEETFGGIEHWVCLLGFNSAKVSCVTYSHSSVSALRWRNRQASTGVDMSPRCGDNLCVLVSSSEGGVALHGLFDSIWDLCGLKDMSARRSAASTQALVMSVAIVVFRRFLCVAGAG